MSKKNLDTIGVRRFLAVSAVIATFFATGCASTANNEYRSNVTLTRAADAVGGYAVAIEIVDLTDEAEPIVLAVPKLRLRPNHRGEISVLEDGAGIRCQATVNESGATPTVATKVTVLRDNWPVWTDEKMTPLSSVE